MSRENLFQKKFRFKIPDRVWIERLFDMRDKIKYPTEGEYVTHILRKYRKSEAVSNGERDQDLDKICRGGELITTCGYYVCSRGGTYSEYASNKRKKPYAFRIGKVAMSLEAVKRICAKCSGGQIRRRV